MTWQIIEAAVLIAAAVMLGAVAIAMGRAALFLRDLDRANRGCGQCGGEIMTGQCVDCGEQFLTMMKGESAMTTEAAARLYEARHLLEMEGRRVAVHNPHSRPVAELPVIYGWNNGGPVNFLSGRLVSEDGIELGGHACSSEAYMPHDLGILEGTMPERHKTFRQHYPDGYRMEFVPYRDAPSHAGLCRAMERAEQIYALKCVFDFLGVTP